MNPSKLKNAGSSGAHAVATTSSSSAAAHSSSHASQPVAASSATATTTTTTKKSAGGGGGGRSTAFKAAVGKKGDIDYVSQVDFSTMEDRVLKRYSRTFKLRRNKSSRERERETRDDLVGAVTRHFNSHEVNEKDTITFFIYTLKNQENVFKLPAKPPIASN
ncbi:hypothetical protein HDU87_000921 [Geranomyces variabilis]|uniref:Histone deacetylase complex subunit SAP30 Sin3 binding domain-containing protein n=1 Tax=Geranomyces variabilis TaxID=109894 RepID=A0AAD5TE61_9FUNG|nr:hypothetical protein HDU87_000921 [Geranomyces variabilis]